MTENEKKLLIEWLFSPEAQNYKKVPFFSFEEDDPSSGFEGKGFACEVEGSP